MLKKRIELWWKHLVLHKNKIGLAILFSFLSSYVVKLAGTYVTEKADVVPVNDLILDFIPTIDLSLLFVYGFITIFIFIYLYSLLFEVERLHEIIFMASLLGLIRSFFIVLTHLGPPSYIMPVSFPWPFNGMAFENDFFFSGHTSFPLMGFFVFKNKLARYFFLFMSLLMAVTSLLTHRHYSIDVFAAFFITYGTYKMGEWISKKASKMKIKWF